MYKLENKLYPLFDIRFLELRNQKPGNYVVSYKDWYIFSLFYIYQEGLNVKEYTKKGNKSDGKKVVKYLSLILRDHVQKIHLNLLSKMFCIL